MFLYQPPASLTRPSPSPTSPPCPSSAVFQMKVLCPKMSIHAFLHCGIADLSDAGVAAQAWSQDKVDRLRVEMGQFEVLFIDEVSTTAASNFVGLDALLRRVFDSTKPFGGKTVESCSVHPLRSPKLMSPMGIPMSGLLVVGVERSTSAVVWDDTTT